MTVAPSQPAASTAADLVT
ncbi:hypothetical protein, partial [Frankia sp. CpI1-P]